MWIGRKCVERSGRVCRVQEGSVEVGKGVERSGSAFRGQEGCG